MGRAAPVAPLVKLFTTEIMPQYRRGLFGASGIQPTEIWSFFSSPCALLPCTFSLSVPLQLRSTTSATFSPVQTLRLMPNA